MPFKADLDIDGNTFTVLKCEYEIKRTIDDSGMPNADIKGGTIIVTVPSAENQRDTPDFFTIWACSPRLRKNGTITFQDTREDAAYKTLSFEEAYCVEYKEDFIAKSDSEKGMVETIKLSAKRLAVGDAEHVNR